MRRRNWAAAIHYIVDMIELIDLEKISMLLIEMDATNWEFRIVFHCAEFWRISKMRNEISDGLRVDEWMELFRVMGESIVVIKTNARDFVQRNLCIYKDLLWVDERSSGNICVNGFGFILGGGRKVKKLNSQIFVYLL